ncbi:MAG: hypothetical protein AAGC81_15720 [Pseudomonadota bacterium]
MRRLHAACLAIAVAVTPSASFSQDIDPSEPLSEQLGEVLRGLQETIAPTLRKMIDQFSVLEDIDGFENYGKPEVLPNGDILIPRRPDAPDYKPPSKRDPQTLQHKGVET